MWCKVKDQGIGCAYIKVLLVQKSINRGLVPQPILQGGASYRFSREVSKMLGRISFLQCHHQLPVYIVVGYSTKLLRHMPDSLVGALVESKLKSPKRKILFSKSLCKSLNK